MIKYLLLLFLFLSATSSQAQITMSHNVGDVPVTTGMPSCDYEEKWARAFTLSEFGISSGDKFILTSAQVAISNAYEGAKIDFHIYSLDSEYPDDPKSLDDAGYVEVHEIGDTPEVIQFDFPRPIAIPPSTKRILVVVSQLEDTYNDAFKKVRIAGTEFDNDTSWFSGCREYYDFVDTEEMANPVYDANYYINITGRKIDEPGLNQTYTLSNNLCGEPIKTSMWSCKYSKVYYGRVFDLADFEISDNETFTINYGQTAVTGAQGGEGIIFNIYEVDDNFPTSFSESNLIGSSQIHQLNYASSWDPELVTVQFEDPVVVPKDVKKILVEVTNYTFWGSGVFFIAGTEEDIGESYFRGCGITYPGHDRDTYIPMSDPAYDGYGGYPDAKYFINVSGDVSHVTSDFEINVSNICSEFLKEFSVAPAADIASIIWNFGDPASGADNTSTDISPYHDFTVDGNYTITATIIAKDGRTVVLNKTLNVTEPPEAYGIDNIYACENTPGSGFSFDFDVSDVTQQVLRGQTDVIVSFVDQSGNEYEELPNPFSNTIANRETITVRLSRPENTCCYSETTFDIIINPLPDVTLPEEIVICDNDYDGFADFDLTSIYTSIANANPVWDARFFHDNDTEITTLSQVTNLTANRETITIDLVDTNTGCTNSRTIDLVVSTIPIAHPIEPIIGCDDNDDGISAYFDTSLIAQTVIKEQTGVEISYYDSNGMLVTGGLPDPYTNTTPYEEQYYARVTNIASGCYAETLLTFKTSSKPEINTPLPLYACNEGDGFGTFDTSSLIDEITGGQPGLKVSIYDSNGTALPDPLPAGIRNTEAYQQTLTIKVENALNSLCVSETTVDLIIQELPTLLLDQTYFLCDLEPSLQLNVASGMDSYTWTFEDGTVISQNPDATLTDAGIYTLSVSLMANGILCTNTYSIELIRSALPQIVDVKTIDMSGNNYIEIIASGDGDFEYSIDGLTYQQSNSFTNIAGGKYTVRVRDRLGCGEDSAEVLLMDYPRFFTPNGDGYNDYWQLQGLDLQTQTLIYIYDRYGKLLKQLDPHGLGWDGTYRGKPMPADDYWFKATLGDGTIFNAHFALKR